MSHANEEHSGSGHTLSMKMLGGTFLALLALTVLTVWTGKMDLHGFDLTVAMLIATVKASLVCLIFMHLKWDRPFNGFIFMVAVVFVGMFLALTLMDTAEYDSDVTDWTKQNISETETE